MTKAAGEAAHGAALDVLLMDALTALAPRFVRPGAGRHASRLGSRADRAAPRAASGPGRRAGPGGERALASAGPPSATGASPIPAWESSWLFRRLVQTLPRRRARRSTA